MFSLQFALRSKVLFASSGKNYFIRTHIHFSSTCPPQQINTPPTILVLNEGKIGPFSILSSGISVAWPAKNPFYLEGSIFTGCWLKN